MKNQQSKSTAKIKVVPPPLIFLVMIFTGLALHLFFPPTVKIQSLFIRIFFALLFIGFSGIIAFHAMRVMKDFKTDIIFKKPTSNLVVTGPFRFSRNPLYVSLLLLYPGIGILINSIWFLPLLILLFIVLRQIVLKEEKSLNQLFPKEFQTYKNSVRRWF